MKTSVTLSEDLVDAVDGRARQRGQSRSEFIEAAVRAVIEQLSRDEQDARDREILDRRADTLNLEAADALEYQVLL